MCSEKKKMLKLLSSLIPIYLNEALYLFWGRFVVGQAVPRPRKSNAVTKLNKSILATGLC